MVSQLPVLVRACASKEEEEKRSRPWSASATQVFGEKDAVPEPATSLVVSWTDLYSWSSFNARVARSVIIEGQILVLDREARSCSPV
jgi:hypothetical protein